MMTAEPLIQIDTVIDGIFRSGKIVGWKIKIHSSRVALDDNIVTLHAIC